MNDNNSFGFLEVPPTIPNTPDEVLVTGGALPKNIKPSIFNRVTTAAEVLYLRGNGKMPSIDSLSAESKVPVTILLKVLQSQAFLKRMKARGINWKSSDNRGEIRLTTEQAAAINFLTDPTSKLDLTQRLKKAGITYSVYRNWLRNPAFSALIRGVAETNLDAHLPDFHTQVIKRGLAGDLKAIQFAYELTGRHDPAKQQAVDMSRLVMLLLEVITRHITDPDKLLAINADIDLVLKGKTPVAIEELPANYIASEIVPEGFFEEIE